MNSLFHVVLTDVESTYRSFVKPIFRQRRRMWRDHLTWRDVLRTTQSSNLNSCLFFVQATSGKIIHFETDSDSICNFVRYLVIFFNVGFKLEISAQKWMHFKLLNMITDNVISRFLWSIWQRPIYTFLSNLGMELIFMWILLSVSQSDGIKASTVLCMKESSIVSKIFCGLAKLFRHIFSKSIFVHIIQNLSLKYDFTVIQSFIQD